MGWHTAQYADQIQSNQNSSDQLQHWVFIVQKSSELIHINLLLCIIMILCKPTQVLSRIPNCTYSISMSYLNLHKCCQEFLIALTVLVCHI